jgi:hypothetical protein
MNGQIGHSGFGKSLGKCRPGPCGARPRAFPDSDIGTHIHVGRAVGIYCDGVRGHVDIRRRKPCTIPRSTVKVKNVLAAAASKGDVQRS